MFSIGSHKARCFFITKVVYLPPVKLGVVLLTQNKRGVSNVKFETPPKFDKGIGRFEEKPTFFGTLGVRVYVESRKRR